jgi:DNA mismatch repair protein MutL
MGIRIKQLPPLIANQIAAGEVIERPASVVKELLENSCDAGSDSIIIEIAYGGLNQIKISDNGVGIIAEDLPLAVAAHATSKISSLNDLYQIESLGFRGEALASIASIAKLTISSKPENQIEAMMLRVNGTECSIAPCARTMGTTVDVIDLFFNAPVRKRFLKNERLEFQAIETVVKRFALSVPKIAILLKHNGKQILSLPAATNEQTRLTRITRIFGNAFMKEAIYLDIAHAEMKLSGWISGSNFQRSQNDRSWIYINQRMVKDKLIYNALKQAYGSILHPGRFPACVLYLTINPAEIDVNVHPTKHEVRFQHPRLVFDFFSAQLKAALATKNDKQESYALAGSNKDETRAVYEPFPPTMCRSHDLFPGLSKVNKESEKHKERRGDRFEEMELPWIILNNRYILVFIQEQPYVVNVFALYQDKLQKQIAQRGMPLASRPLLVPICYSFPDKKPNRLDDLQQLFQTLGMSIEWINEAEVLIRSIPLCMPYLDLSLFLNTIPDWDTIDAHQLIVLMQQAQRFDPRLLTNEEKMELNFFLLQMHQSENGKPGVFKKLNSEDCTILLG